MGLQFCKFEKWMKIIKIQQAGKLTVVVNVRSDFQYLAVWYNCKTPIKKEPGQCISSGFAFVLVRFSYGFTALSG